MEHVHVALPDALAGPRAVVVVLLDAHVAVVAVDRADRPVPFAPVAEGGGFVFERFRAQRHHARVLEGQHREGRQHGQRQDEAGDALALFSLRPALAWGRQGLTARTLVS